MMRRLILTTLLAAMLAAMYGVGRAISVPATSMLTMLAFGAMAGMPIALLVLFVAKRTTDEAQGEIEYKRPAQELNIPHSTWPQRFTDFGITGNAEEWLEDEAPL